MTPPPPPRRGLVVSGVMLGLFLGAMESTAVATAMPTVIASLGRPRHLLVGVLGVHPRRDHLDAALGPVRGPLRPVER